MIGNMAVAFTGLSDCLGSWLAAIRRNHENNYKITMWNRSSFLILTVGDNSRPG